MYKNRLHSLDALRTVAALAVVLAHWPQHFFSVDAFAQPLEAAPFYGWLSKVYENGASAVTFFFCLSGFIFYWLYGDKVHSNQISFGSFANLRISRLYPLHLATLLALVPLVLIFHKLFGYDFIYENNDLYHFGLNLAFVQYWGFQNGYSWDGPSWSISVEIALYILFFALCRVFRPNGLQALGLMIIALALARFSIIGAAAIAFFSGGLTYSVFIAAQRHKSALGAFVVVGATVLIWVLFAPLMNDKMASSFVDAVRNIAPGGIIGDLSSRVAQIFCGRVRELALFPSLIFAAAFLESATPSFRWPMLGGIGNISFGVYLLHFPLQLMAITIAAWLSMPKDTFARPSAFIVFFVILLSVSVASYHWFERPSMLALRSRAADASRRRAQSHVKCSRL
jgi:peptidoglycan/LPS O-acetylase OafA/YrhL